MLFILRLIFGKTIGLWLLRSLTDDKGEASSRRISALYLMVLYGIAHMVYLYIMVQADGPTQIDLAKHLVWMMGVDVVGALLYIGLVTVQNIQTFAETMKGQKHAEATTTEAVTAKTATESSTPASEVGI